MKWPLKDKIPLLPSINSPGDFGYKRSFYYHPGIDIYCDFGQEVQAMESGTIVNIEIFTGANANPPSPWWRETSSIIIEGPSGALGYCELKPLPHIHVGYKVVEGEIIANIVPVLNQDKGNGTTMLHFEKYKPGTRHHVTWYLDSEKPDELLDPREFLEILLNQ